MQLKFLLKVMVSTVLIIALAMGFMNQSVAQRVGNFPEYKSMYVDQRLPEIARIERERAMEERERDIEDRERDIERQGDMRRFEELEGQALAAYMDKKYSQVIGYYNLTESTGYFTAELYYAVGLSYQQLGNKAKAAQFLRKAADNGIESARTKLLELFDEPERVLSGTVEVFSCSPIYDRPDQINGKQIEKACNGIVTILSNVNERYYKVQYKEKTGFMHVGMFKN